MECVIRKKELKDCRRVAEVTVQCWNEAYKGIVDDKFLEDIKTRIDIMTTRAKESLNDSTSKYVLEVNNKIVGFINFSESEIEEYKGYGEIKAFYIIEEYHNYGLGRKLFEYAINKLGKKYKKIVIGCLSDNKTTKFYEHMGAKLDKVVKRPTGYQLLNENMYILTIK